VRVKLAANGNRRFKFQKRRQYFIGTHNEPLSVIAMLYLFAATGEAPESGKRSKRKIIVLNAPVHSSYR
jgi:hypothetical protein